jgi:hypothetical protein
MFIPKVVIARGMWVKIGRYRELYAFLDKKDEKSA